jgi:ABC-type branched-subunit amino acid transport system ATPase component/ABC-type branched-subunit amino acid transport system permease subunit
MRTMWSRLLRREGTKSLSLSALVTVVGLAAVLGLGGGFNDTILVYTICYAIVLVGMVLQVGYSHQLAFHQAVFMMAGAYAVAVLNTKFGWPVPLSMVVAVAGSAAVGALIGSYITRVPGFALALVTLFFTSIAGGFVSYSGYLGSVNGLGPVQDIWPGVDYEQTFERGGVIAMLLLGLAVLFVSRIMRSGIGLELQLMSTSEKMAQSVGIMTARRKLELFVYGSALAALGGAVFATTQHFISPDTFTQQAQITLLVMLYFGGRTSLVGALIGALVIEYIAGVNNFVAINQGIIEAVLMTAVLLFAPNGVIGVLESAAARFLALRRSRLPGGSRSRDEPPGDSLAPQPQAAESTAALISSPAPAAGTAAGAGDAAAPRIECRSVTRRFGGVVAVDQVSLAIHGAGIHAICGPNGAGKSTLFEVIAGSQRADRGQVFINGQDVTRASASHRAQLGMARTFQTVGLMNGRSVLDNVAVAALDSHRTFMTRALVRSELAEARERALAALRRLGLEDLAQRRPGRLTLEAQRMVELARAVVARPQIVLLDEPASGLSAEQRERLARTLTEMSEYTTIVLVEHDLKMVAEISSEIFVLIEGHLVFHGSGEEFTRSQIVRTELMGLAAAAG